MTNREFLRRYWLEADKQEDVLLKRLARMHPEDTLQDALNRFRSHDGMTRLDRGELNRLHRDIADWKADGILSGEFGLRARDAENRKRITADDAFLLYLMAAWTEYYYEVEVYAVEMYLAATGATNAEIQERIAEPIAQTAASLHDALAVDAAYRARQIQKRVVIDRARERKPSMSLPEYKRILEQARRWLLAPSAPTEYMPNGHHGYLDRVMADLLSFFAIETYRRDGVREVQFVATLDDKTTHNCRRLDGQIFSIEDLRPGINAPPIADPPHHCRSVLKPLETLQLTGKSGIIKTNKQFGKKIGKHAVDYGLDPSKEDDRAKMAAIIDDIASHCNERRIGHWRGQEDEVIFYIKDEDVVITKNDGEFVTILKGGITNARVQNARKS